MKRNLNIRTKLAMWLSKCARRIDPQGYQHYPLPNTPEPILFSPQVKSVERIMAQISYSRTYLNKTPEQFEENYILPEIAEKIADELLECGFVKVEPIDTPYGRQWIATLYVVKI